MELQNTPSTLAFERHRRPLRRWRKLIYLAVLIIVVSVVRSSVVDWNDVMSGSMAPSIQSGDRLLVNKIAYGLRVPFTNHFLTHWSLPQRGDVVTFIVRDKEEDDEIHMVKRIVGVPGDRVEYRRGRLKLNGEVVELRPITSNTRINFSPYDEFKHELRLEMLPGRPHPVLFSPASPGPSFFELTVPPGKYFMMGDNRDNSEDSRFFGPVPLKDIHGRISRIVFSLDPDQGFKPRENRSWVELP